MAAIVGSSNFTGAGLTTNRELNLSHKTALTEEETLRIGPAPLDGREEVVFRRELMSGVGAQAITELDRWFRERWEESRDFKEELIELPGRVQVWPGGVYPLSGIHEGPL